MLGRRQRSAVTDIDHELEIVIDRDRTDVDAIDALLDLRFALTEEAECSPPSG